MINIASKSYGNNRIKKIFLSQKAFCDTNIKQNLTLGLFTKCWYHGRECPTSNVLELLHDSPPIGHFGICIESCNMCPKRKTTKQKHRHSLKKRKPSYLFWQVSLDIMGPLPDPHGNKYILLISEQFSKRCEAIASPNQEANAVSRAFVEHWIV